MLTNITVTSAAGTHLNETLGYTANGNIASVAQSAGGPNSPTFSNSFSYDGLDRLTTATGTLFASETYSFDTLGRMTSRTVGGTVRSYTYSAAHPDAPTSYNSVNYTYDANGSQVSTSAGQSRTFDPEDRLISVSDGSTSSQYIYDANGQRLLTGVTAGGTTRRTLYIGGIYEEQLGSGSTNYYSCGGKAVGLRRSGWPNGNGQYRLVGDHLGSTTLLVDTATPPNVVQRQYHKPYGEIAFQWTVGGSLTSVSFTGQRLDSDTGLMYYGARFYDPVLGYFVSADPTTSDPKKSSDLNRYLYARGNPLRYIDPSGYGPQDHYVLVNGCVGPGSCGPHPDWGEYLNYLHQLFIDGDWQWQEMSSGSIHQVSWEAWAQTHVHIVNAPSAAEGADNIRDTLAGIGNIGEGHINLLGHSAGAGAIMTYLVRAMHGTVTLDQRITSAVLIDGPLGAHQPGWEGFTNRFTQTERDEAIGGWLSSHTHIKIVSIDTPNDWVNSSPLHGVPTVLDPHYHVGPNGPQPVQPQDWALGPRNDWHTYTMTHLADETRQFLQQAWQ